MTRRARQISNNIAEDVLVARNRVGDDLAREGKAMLVRIVSMLMKLTDKLLGPGTFG